MRRPILSESAPKGPAKIVYTALNVNAIPMTCSIFKPRSCPRKRMNASVELPSVKITTVKRKYLKTQIHFPEGQAGPFGPLSLAPYLHGA